MSEKSVIKHKKPPNPPKADAFQNRQLDLFRRFLCNGEDERDSLSNLFDLWDCIPRYAISRQQQDKWRKAKDFPILHKIPFHHRGRELEAKIQPAAVEGKDGAARQYYPSANEELIEDVLRKIAAEQNAGYHDSKEQRTGVCFTLHMVRKELAKRGHTRSYQEIYLSLKILASSIIEIHGADGKGGEGFTVNPYFSGLAAVSKSKLTDDPEAKWFVDFHPLVSRSLDQLTYRQFNYARLMSHNSQLARWLNRVLCLKYLNADLLHPFDMRFSTIARDSGLLNGYAVLRLAVAAVDSAFTELQTCKPPLIVRMEKKPNLGARNKILDVVYTLFPSREFVAEMKAASKRQNDSVLEHKLL